MKPVHVFIEVRREGSDAPINRFQVSMGRSFLWTALPDSAILVPEGRLVQFAFYSQVIGHNGLEIPTEHEIRTFGKPDPPLFGKRAIALENK